MNQRAPRTGPVEEVRQFLGDFVDGAAGALAGNHPANRKALAFHFQHLHNPRGLALDGSPASHWEQQEAVDVLF
jgi:hypothetical protein